MKIGYTRISTADQNADGQADALTAASVERIFADTGTGSNTDRPALQDMLERLRAGDTVTVWRLDRLARSLKDLIELAAAFESRGVQLVSLTEGIDTTTTAGKLFFHIFGAIAEFERNLIIERTHAGLASARSRGRLGGRRPVLDADKMKTVKTLLRAAKKAGTDPDFGSIARSVQVSERTIRRFDKGNYKGAAV